MLRGQVKTTKAEKTHFCTQNLHPCRCTCSGSNTLMITMREESECFFLLLTKEQSKQKNIQNK